jgi:hypothetical protein
MTEDKPKSKSDEDLREEVEAAEAEKARQRAIESERNEVVVYPEVSSDDG